MVEAQVSLGTLQQDADLKSVLQEQHAKKRGLRSTLFLSYAAIGVIFGDIGTSPLYVFSSTFQDGIPNLDSLFGATSLIFWTLTIIVVIKYLLLVIQADDNGEGGTFALYSLICRYCNITPGNFSTVMPQDTKLVRYSSTHTAPPQKRTSWAGTKLRSLFATSPIARNALLSVVLLMTSLVLGDAILTPAQTVLGAIYGLQVREPQVSQGVVVGVSCAIIILIFSAQKLGTSKLGVAFAPILLLWFLFNLIINIYNIATYQPGIFKCFSPSFAYYYFRDNKHQGWEMLAGIFLTVTGAEASFADLGHFSRTAIRIAFIGICYPCLVITYFGQAAWLVHNQDQVGNTFYASIPFGDGFYWVTFTIATAAACVASQTMISAAFSLLRQSMFLGCFPRLTIHHSSKKVEGQIYISEANWLMMVLTVIVVAVFKTTTQLGNAYGVAVSGMMFGTTCLISIVMIVVWDVHLAAVIAVFLIFGFVDMVYLSANLTKVPHGGWLTLAIAGGVCLFSHIWHHGMWEKHVYEVKNEKKLSDHLLMPKEVEEDPSQVPSADSQLVLAATGKVLMRTPGLAVFYNDQVLGVPPSLTTFLSRSGSLPQTTIILTVRRVAVSNVSETERLVVAPTIYPGVLRCVARYGYTDIVDHDPAFIASILAQAAMAVPTLQKVTPDDAKNTMYICTSPHLRIDPAHKHLRRAFEAAVIEGVYNPMVKHLARRPWESWGIPMNGLYESHHVYQI
ncbi:hypothetical protein WJX73_004356 [Symbiochloris irregularis]|uniref:Potassium transporter n=1 Tax=Symbiochloris irregularis TaxID=706552 RepID=A0AAW1NNA0_9CHLO